MVVGVDEAGRGPLAGPVVSCALCFKKRLSFSVKDSKKTSRIKREKLFDWLLKNSLFFIGIATNREIDELNILEATFLSFNRAIRGLIRKDDTIKKANFIIDGNLFKTDLKLKYSCIVKADEKIKEVSCASIMAKVVRDYLLRLSDAAFPNWNFPKHKGYPTKEHIDLIRRYSISSFHRKSFCPCNER